MGIYTKKAKRYAYWYIVSPDEEEQNGDINPETILDMVKIRYARMENEELIYLAHNNGYGLSTEAISALYKEFLKRRLDTRIFPELRSLSIANPSINEKEIQQRHDNAPLKNLQESCLNALSKGRSLDELFLNLQKTGLRNGVSLKVINSLKKYTKEIEDKYDIEMMSGAVFCLLGVFLSVIILWSGRTGVASAGWLLICFGVIRICFGYHKKEKYRKPIQMFKVTEMPYLGTMHEKSIIKN